MLDDARIGARLHIGSGLLSESGLVEAFSDGVLAIAITLLVLDLKNVRVWAAGTYLPRDHRGGTRA